MRRTCWLALLVLTTSACSSLHEVAYYPDPTHPDTRLLSEVLWHAAKAGRDDPGEYSFAMIRSPRVAAYTVEDATFYFTEGLAHQPVSVIEALVAHEVSHELLGHIGQRRAVALSLLNVFVNPLFVRTYTRDQEIAADLKAVEILQNIGHDAPRRTLADALRAAAAINGPPRGGWLTPEVSLEDRLGRLEPLETEKRAAN